MFRNKGGFTVLGVVIAIGIMAAMASGMLLLVATNQATRTQQLYMDQAYYSSHAAFEYAQRQIRVEGNLNPLPVRQFSGESFSITRTAGRINVTATQRSASNAFSMIDPIPPTEANCLTVDTTGATVGNNNDDDDDNSSKKLRGIILKRASNCARSFTLVSITASWLPNDGEKLKKIQIDGNTVYDHGTGQVSGSNFDITDIPINDSNNHPIDFFRWNTNIRDHNFTFIFHMSDSSQKSVTVNFMPANQSNCLTVGTGGAYLSPEEDKLKDLKGLTLQNTCGSSIGLDKMTVSWTPVMPNRTLNQIKIEGGNTYNPSAQSGVLVDVDYTLNANSTHQVEKLRFSDEMLGRNYTIVWEMVDGTTKTTSLNLFASNQNNCLTIDTTQVTRGGSGNKDLRGITLRNSCGSDIGIVALTCSWSGEPSQKMKRVEINGNTVYNSNAGIGSGVQADFEDEDVYMRDDGSTIQVDWIRFHQAVTPGLTFTLDFLMSDATIKSATVWSGN